LLAFYADFLQQYDLAQQ